MKRPVITLALLVLAACGDDGPSCPDYSDEPSIFIPTGTYTGEDTCEPDYCEIPFPPREGGTDYELEVDRSANIVVIRFLRDGVSVEERWRIVERHVED